MATQKISDLTEATEFNNNDYTMIIQNGLNKKINKQNLLKKIYSLQETVTGEYWIDNKPIYRKVIIFNGTSSDNREFEIAKNDISLNIERFIKLGGFVEILGAFSDPTVVAHNIEPIPFYYGEVDRTYIYYDDTNKKVVVGLASTGLFPKIYAILEYTKTTD